MKRFLQILIAILSLLLALVPGVVFGQGMGYTQLYGTYAPYANGSYFASFVNQSSAPQLPLLNGSTFQQQVNGNFDSYGNLSMYLADNGIIVPTPTKWQVTACQHGGATPACCTQTLTVTGSTQSWQGFLSTCPYIPPAGGAPGPPLGSDQYNGGLGFVGGSWIDPNTYPGADLNLRLAAVCTAFTTATQLNIRIPANVYTVGEVFNWGASGCPPNTTIDATGATIQGDGALTGTPAVVGHGVWSISGTSTTPLVNPRVEGGTFTNGVPNGYAYVYGEDCIDVNYTTGARINGTQTTSCAGIQALGGNDNSNIQVTDNVVDTFAYEGIAFGSGNDGVLVQGNVVRNCHDDALILCYGIAVAGQNTDPVNEPYSRHVKVAHNQIYNIWSWEGLDAHGGYDLDFDGNTIANTYNAAQLGTVPYPNDCGYLIDYVSSTAPTGGTPGIATYHYASQCGGAPLSAPIFKAGQQVAIVDLQNSILDFADRPATIASVGQDGNGYFFTVQGPFPAIAQVADTGVASYGFLSSLKVQHTTATQGYVDGALYTMTSYTGYAGVANGGNPLDVPATLTITLATVPSNWQPYMRVACVDSQASGSFNQYISNYQGQSALVRNLLLVAIHSINGNTVVFEALAGHGIFPTTSGAQTPTTPVSCSLNSVYGIVLAGGPGQPVSDYTISDVFTTGYGAPPITDYQTVAPITVFGTAHGHISDINCASYWGNCVNFYFNNYDVDVTNVTGGNMLGAPAGSPSFVVGVSAANNSDIRFHAGTFQSSTTFPAYRPTNLIADFFEDNQISITDAPRVSSMALTGSVCAGYLLCGLTVPPNNTAFPSSLSSPTYYSYHDSEAAYDVYGRRNWTFSGPSANQSSGIFSNNPLPIALGTIQAGTYTLYNLKSCQASSFAIVSTNLLTLTCNTFANWTGSETGLYLSGFSTLQGLQLNGVGPITITGQSSTSCASTTGTCSILTATLPGTFQNVSTTNDAGYLGAGGAFPVQWFSPGYNLTIAGANHPLVPPSAPTLFTKNFGGTLTPGQRCYVVTALNNTQSTQGGTETCITIPSGTSANVVAVEWTQVIQSTGYNLYAGATGAETLCVNQPGVGSTSYIDTGSCGSSGSVPTTNNTSVPLQAHVIPNDPTKITLDQAPANTVVDAKINYVAGTVNAAQSAIDPITIHHGNPSIPMGEQIGDANSGGPADWCGTTYGGGYTCLFNAIYPTGGVDQVQQVIPTLPSTAFRIDNSGWRIFYSPPGTAAAPFSSFFYATSIQDDAGNVQFGGQFVASGIFFASTYPATVAGGTGIGSAACSGQCHASRGAIAFTGGTATTGTIATVTFSPPLQNTPVCGASQNGGTYFGIGLSGITNTGFNITSSVSVSGATFGVTYWCQL